MADEKDDLEKMQKELLRHMEEEQARQQADEDAERLRAETVEAFEDTKKRLEEMVDGYKKQLDDVKDQYSKAVEEVGKKIGGGQNSEWTKVFSAMGTSAGLLLGEAMHHSLRLSIDSANVGDLQPGLGRAAKQIATMLGGAIGALFTGGMGIGIGAAAGFGIGSAIDDAGMQFEGYRMLGAKTANLAQGGLRYDYGIEDIGRKYRESIRDITMSTGATSDAAGQAIATLARLGVGFLEGGKDAAEFALGMDNVLKLQPGTILRLQTELVRQYGESIGAINPVLREVVAMTDDYAQVQTGANRALAQSFSSSMNVVDALGQITSQARSSGASMESMTMIAHSLIDTMVLGRGAGLQRHEQVVRGAGSALAALMPHPTGNTTSEAMPSGVTRYFMGATPFGQSQMDAAMRIGTDRLKMSPEFAQANMQSLASMLMAGPGGGKASIRWALANLAGINERLKNAKNGDQAWMMLQQAGMSNDAIAQVIPLVDTMRSAGVFEARDPMKAYAHFLNAAPTDEKHKAAQDHMKALQAKFREMGDQSKSAMEHAAAALTDVSTYFNKTYWSEARDAVRSAFGLKQTQEEAARLSEKQKAAVALNTPSGTKNFVENAMRTLAVATGDPLAGYTDSGLYSGWVAQTHTTVINQQTNNGLKNEDTRASGGMQTTGGK